MPWDVVHLMRSWGHSWSKAGRQALWITPGLDLCPGPQSSLPVTLPTCADPSAAAAQPDQLAQTKGESPVCHHPREHHALGFYLLGWCLEPALVLTSEHGEE